MTKSISPVAGITMLSGVIAASHLGKISPAITALQTELQLSMVAAGFLLSLMQFTGMIAGMIFGLYCDRLGAKKSIILGQAILLVASLIGAAAVSPRMMLALRAVESLGLLLVVLPTPGLLRRIVPAAQLPWHMGLWSCYVAIGTSLSFFFGPIVIETIGWRAWWMLPAGASGLAIVLLVKWLPWENSFPKENNFGLTARRLFEGKDAWLVGVAFALYAGQWLAVVGFAPTLFVDQHASSVVAGARGALVALAGILGSVSAAHFLHTGVRPITLLKIGYGGMMLMTFAAFSSSVDASPLLKYIAIVLFSAIGGLIPGCLYLLAVRSAHHEHLLAFTIGRVQQLTSMGMCLAPPLFAKVSTLAGGWQETWWVCVIASVIALAALSALDPEKSPDALTSTK